MWLGDLQPNPLNYRTWKLAELYEVKESEPASLLTAHEFPRIQLFLNNHSQYIKISALLSRVKGIASETVNSLSEQMITEPRNPFVLGAGDINSLKVSVAGNCSAFIMSTSCIIHECHKNLKNWHFIVKMINQPLYLSFLLHTAFKEIPFRLQHIPSSPLSFLASQGFWHWIERVLCIVSLIPIETEQVCGPEEHFFSLLFPYNRDLRI